MRSCIVLRGYLLLIILTFIFLCIPIALTSDYGESSGTASIIYPVTFDFSVIDPDGNPVKNALVEVFSLEKEVFSVETLENGSIPQQDLSGFTNYTMLVEAAGYIPYDMSFRLVQNANWKVSMMILSFNVEIAVLFAATVFWTLLFLRSNFESITNGVLAWMFSWGTGFYWLASSATIPAIAWLFVAWGLVTLYLAIISFLAYRKVVASR